MFAAAVAHGGAVAGGRRCPASAIAAFVYVRVIVLMYFSEPAGDTTTVVTPSVVTTLALTVGTVATLVLGILPSPVLDLASSSSLFLR